MIRGRKHALVPFKVRIEKLREKDPSKRDRFLDNFDGKGADLLSLYSAFLVGLPADKLIEREDHHFGGISSVERRGRTVRATWISGQSGVDSHLKDDHEGTEFWRRSTAVERLEFMTQFSAPSNSILGVFIVQQIGGKSLSWRMRKEFVLAFKRKYPGYALRITAVSRENLWAAAEAAGDLAEVSALTVTREGIETNELAQIGLGADDNVVGRFVQTYDMKDFPQRGRVLKRARKKLTNGLVAATAPDDLKIESVEGFDVEEAELVEGVVEITATVRLPGEDPVTVKYTGARPPQIRYWIDDSEGSDITPLRFYTETTTHTAALLRSGQVRLEPGWDDGQWEHPSAVLPLEVQANDPGPVS